MADLRFYDSVVGNPQSLNRYAYVTDNPTTLTDPLGLADCSKAPNPRACWIGSYWGSNPNPWAGGLGTWNPFSLIGIPVVTESFTSPQLLSTINFGAMANANGYASSVALYSPGGFTTTYVGDAFTIFGSSTGSCGFVCQGLHAVANFVAPPLPPNVRIGILPFGFGGVAGALENATIAGEATTAVGRLGSPIEIQPGTNVPATINGIDYSGHALDKMQGTGLVPSVGEDALLNGVQTNGRNGATVFTTGQAVVVQAADGTIITAYPQ